MTCSTCPNCGFDLEQLRELSLGALSVQSGGAVIRWKGEEVKLTATERLIVCAVARAGGAVIKDAALREAIGYEGDNGPGLISVHICRIRKAFRAIEPDFDALDTGQPPAFAPQRHKRINRTGVRWRI